MKSTKTHWCRGYNVFLRRREANCLVVVNPAQLEDARVEQRRHGRRMRVREVLCDWLFILIIGLFFLFIGWHYPASVVNEQAHPELSIAMWLARVLFPFWTLRTSSEHGYKLSITNYNCLKPVRTYYKVFSDHNILPRGEHWLQAGLRWSWY